MVHLDQKQVAKLLKLVKNVEERRLVKKFLNDLQNIDFANSMPSDVNIISKKRSAKKALDIICRIGLELGEHAIVHALLHLLD